VAERTARHYAVPLRSRFLKIRDRTSLTPESLREWSKEKLAAYKYPRELEFVESLPMNATRKILRRELRAAEQVSG